MNSLSTLLVNREVINAFADLTDDHSPIHTDPEFAQQHGLPANLAHGLLGASWAVSHVQAKHIPAGEKPVSMTVNFGQPVFCGESLNLLVNQASPAPFELLNEAGGRTCHGELHFARDWIAQPELLDAGSFVPKRDKVYFAQDMLVDGPRGSCEPFSVSSDQCRAFAQFSGAPIGDRDVPGILVFCLGFSHWLKAFTAVPTPDASFPGHVQDRWQQHFEVMPGDELVTIHQPVACRSSKSREGMALLEIALQVVNQRDQVVLSGSVLLMMPEKAGA